MSAPLMKSVSGIRGIVGESLTPELVTSVAAAFAAYANGGTVVVGRDSRCTGGAIAQCVSSVLALAGCDVVDIGIVPTPTVQVMVEHLKAAGGIIISASHNPIEWNAFKLVNKTGTFLNAEEIASFFERMERAGAYRRWDAVGSITCRDDAGDIHMARVREVINERIIKRKKFSIALDSVNGAGSIITQTFLKKLGCAVHPVHCTITGTFPRGAEPLPENLKDLSRAVKRTKAHIGFAQDPDADRLAIVDERGRPIGEENTIALVVEHLLSRKKGRVVVNLSTTKAVDDVAARYGAPVVRTRVGEINVVDEMRRGGARIGGEGNGGVISPEVHLGRDSLVGIGYILEMMAERGKTISELVADLPRYTMIKGKVEFRPGAIGASFFDQLAERYRGERITDIDGVRIDFERDEAFRGGWVHLRASNTEPIFRIIAEGRTKAQAEGLYAHFAAMVE